MAARQIRKELGKHLQPDQEAVQCVLIELVGADE
jgi:hypothetical protein